MDSNSIQSAPLMKWGWEALWQPVIRSVGSVLAPADDLNVERVVAESIRRWCEPLEFDCALHHDAEVARLHGFGDVIAPYTSLGTFLVKPLWLPGEPALFRDSGVDAQPARDPIGFTAIPGAPPTSGFFATDVEFDYVRPPRVGDRLRRGPRELTGCVPKRTRVGDGAFITITYAVMDHRDDEIAKCRNTFYYYNPHTEETAYEPG
ncbi:FAS1-like dehydratase domain-containing protein [Rhodococcus qingshengii]|uniref:FAS1-like dehydratase domain-containing protein n=1 Tax=Rhodococcus qingshengii TaxID=334542 RepID=UPI001C2447C8|nr:MaoC family dehydratase N-terminal domain-containing protein [Rhodococcus qingshengii]